MDRQTGKARSFVIDGVSSKAISPILVKNIYRETRLVTDEANVYRGAETYFDGHGVVQHSVNEWKRGTDHTNTIEGFFSIFKRGMKGIYQHCGEQHLHRYLAEFDFRYSHRAANGTDDTARANAILRGAEGKRLTYRRADSVVA